jgi:hypothetical protein
VGKLIDPEGAEGKVVFDAEKCSSGSLVGCQASFRFSRQQRGKWPTE